MKIAFTECLHQGKDGPLYYEASEICENVLACLLLNELGWNWIGLGVG